VQPQAEAGAWQCYQQYHDKILHTKGFSLVSLKTNSLNPKVINVRRNYNMYIFPPIVLPTVIGPAWPAVKCSTLHFPDSPSIYLFFNAVRPWKHNQK
jgi:hypothetical protein